MEREPAASRPERLALGAGLIAPLVIVSGMPPLATASYLPGLPVIANDLDTTITLTQLTLTVFIVGLAIGQLTFGPISDRIGRRPPLLGGIIAYVLVSAATVFVPSIEWLLVFRFLQGFCASSGVVLARAIIRDLSSGTRAAKALSTMSAAGLLVPAIAPLLGATILAFADWRTVFAVLAVLGVGLGIWAAIAVKESHPRFAKPLAAEAEPIAAGSDAAPPAPVTVHERQSPNAAQFWLYALVVAFSFVTMYAFIAAAPFILQEVYGFDETGYALVGAGLSVVMGAVGILGSRLLGRSSRFGVLTPRRLVAVGLAIIAIGAACVLTAVLLGASVWWIIAALVVAVAPVAFLTGAATSIAMDASPFRAGATSALIGCTQAAFGATAPPLVGIAGANPVPMAIVLASSAALAVAAASTAELLRNRRKPQ